MTKSDKIREFDHYYPGLTLTEVAKRLTDMEGVRFDPSEVYRVRNLSKKPTAPQPIDGEMLANKIRTLRATAKLVGGTRAAIEILEMVEA